MSYHQQYGPPGAPSALGPGSPPAIHYNPNGSYRGGGGGSAGVRGGRQQGGYPAANSAPHESYQPSVGAQPYPVSSNYNQAASGYNQQHHWQQGNDQQPTPPAAPIVPANYHPNYAGFSQYPPGPAQPPHYPAAPIAPQAPYGAAYPQHGNMSSISQHEWNTHQPHAGYGGRGRTGGDRGGRHVAIPPAPIRMGFEDNRPAPVTYPPPSYPDQSQRQYPSFEPAPVSAPTVPPYDNYGAGGQFNRRGNLHKGPRNSNIGGLRKSGGGFQTHDRHRQRATSLHHSSHNKVADASRAVKKRRTDDIGLTPAQAEDGVDEELRLAEMIGNSALIPKDIEAYLKVRKSNFPSKTRMELVTVTDPAKNESDTQFQLPNVIGGALPVQDETKVKIEPSDQQVQQPKSKLELREIEAAKLRKRLAKLDSIIKRKREEGDTGDDLRDGTDDSSSDSDDDAPEQASASQPVGNQPNSEMVRKADPKTHCKYYSTGGTCGKKTKCRFVHDEAVRQEALKLRAANGGRLTLEQRLLLNDKNQEDLTFLSAIVSARHKHQSDGGGFRPPSEVKLEVQNGSSSDAAPLNTVSQFSSLPPPPPSLPQNPTLNMASEVKREMSVECQLGTKF